MDIKQTFLALTSHTYPYHTEDKVIELLPFKIENLKRDVHGNYSVKIGEGSRTMFTCHLDTASGSFVPVKHVIRKKMVDVRIKGERAEKMMLRTTITSDGKTILGADDKAGLTILLYMIENKVPGTYYFFVGEERGCQGSKPVANSINLVKTVSSEENNPKVEYWSEDYDRCISFDRRGYGSIITHQMGSYCCSDEFALALAEEYTKLGIPSTPDDTGIFTDSASFIGKVRECTNISVGYRHEHGTDEIQDIVYLEKLAKASVKINWEALPVIGPKSVSRYSRRESEWYM